MTLRTAEVQAFLAAGGPAAVIAVRTAKGSTPREAGAWMLVGPRATLGTIGGGQLEYMAIDSARAMLARGADVETLDVPLGPEIGQCCGGRTLLTVERVGAATAAAVLARAERERQALPAVLIFGAGHVGRALGAALALLPVRPVIIDQRAEEMALVPAGIEVRATPLPEAEVRAATPGSAFVILTHDHALDFLIAREALARGDAAYVGMIGSRTKRVSFERWLAQAEGARPDTGALVSPIGAAGRPDKRPEVIAAFTAAEIMQRIVIREKVTTATTR
jgi:xanthine dehydrogenase accessory factor